MCLGTQAGSFFCFKIVPAYPGASVQYAASYCSSTGRKKERIKTMGEAAQVMESTATQAETVQVAAEKVTSAEDIINSSDREKYTGAPLFSEENISKAALMGEEDPPAESTEEKPAETKPRGDKTTQQAQATGGKKTEEAKKADASTTKTEQAAEEVKPPAGFAPIGALHEERAKRKLYFEQATELQNVNSQLSAQVESLTKRLNELAGGDEGGFDPDNFKVLSAKEFKELKESDPDAAIDYLHNKQEFERTQELKNATKRRIASIVNDSHELVRSVIPEVYEGDYGAELSALAVESGLPNNYVSALTSPDTLILPPGAESPIPLGPAAAGLVIMLHNLNTAIKNGNPDKITAKIAEDVKKKTTEELMKKIKTEGQGFTNLDAIAKAGEGSQDSFRPLSEDEIAAMPEAERKAFLGG